MDFTPSESGQTAATLAAEILGASADPWKELAKAGLLSVGPDRAGSDGLGLLDVTVLLTEIGRRAVPVPALATLMTGALPLLRWGRPDLLPAVASGELILTAALRDPAALRAIRPRR